MSLLYKKVGRARDIPARPRKPVPIIQICGLFGNISLDALDELERERDYYKTACLRVDASAEHWRVKHESAALELGRMTAERNAIAEDIDAKCALAAVAVLSDPLMLELLARGNCGREDSIVDLELRERLAVVIADKLK